MNVERTGFQMKVLFFPRNGGLDPEAILPGVYIIKLGKAGEDTKNYAPLYIGESYSMAERCGRHLFEIYKDPSYLGFSPEHVMNPDLCLSFEILEVLERETRGMLPAERDTLLRDHELAKLSKTQTLIQTKTSDSVVKDRCRIVAEYIDKVLR